MHPLRRQLPSLNYLYTVEAVTRHLSFTAAARELGISQPAVSKAIRTTEDALGFSLFARRHRGLALTRKGRIFSDHARRSLGELADIVEELNEQQGRPVIRTCFSSSFVSLWMLPRLSGFKEVHPDIGLRLDESYTDMLNLDAWDIDFSTRLGDGNWSDLQSWFLVSEKVGAVASPDYLARHCDAGTLATLVRTDLIHVDEPKRKRLDWEGWFAKLGQNSPLPKASLTVSDYLSAIDAAKMGQGVALGWDHLVRDKIAQGQLAWVGDHMVETGQGIYLVASKERPASAHGDKFKDWILAQFS